MYVQNLKAMNVCMVTYALVFDSLLAYSYPHEDAIFMSSIYIKSKTIFSLSLTRLYRGI